MSAAVIVLLAYCSGALATADEVIACGARYGTDLTQALAAFEQSFPGCDTDSDCEDKAIATMRAMVR